MLNWAARYFPILRELEPIGDGASVLEIGSGSIGLGKFYKEPFVGCDLKFVAPPRRPMLAVVADASMLPFPTKSFDVVIVPDVLEHVPPEGRRAVISEALRVARRLAIFAFPCGVEAFECDRNLLHEYGKRQLEVPLWLREHMLHSYPTQDLFSGLDARWSVRSFGNEGLRFHYWMMRKEMSRLWNYFFAGLLMTMPRVVERLLRGADREPCYRRIVVMEPISASLGS